MSANKLTLCSTGLRRKHHARRNCIGPWRVRLKRTDRGVALCGSGVGASICANKVAGVRAGLIHDVFSAHQGVEDDDMNVFSLGGQVIGPALAWELIETFLMSRFSGAERHQRRVDKVKALEMHEVAS